MKSKRIIGAIIGATIGMTLAYFGAGSIDAGSLSIGAVIGALLGLYFASSTAVPAGGSSSGRQSGMG